MRRAFVLSALIFAAAGPLEAQSLFSTRGLGVPVAPVDARARTLGGVGVGLLGLNSSLTNPAEIAGVLFRGAALAVQPTSRSIEAGGETGEASATRFPLMRILYPVSSRWAVSLGYGSYLDQSWAIRTRGQTILGQDTLATEDLVSSTGGVAQAQATVAYTLSPALSLGVGAGVLTGELRRDVSRSFPDDASGEVRGFASRSRLSFGAPLLTAGVRWDPRPIVRLGASVTWTGDLEAEVEEGEIDARTFDLPLQVAFGASALLAPRIMAAAAGRWSGWSSAADDFQPSGNGEPATADVWEIGGGIEWQGPRTGSRDFPIRLGFSYAQLPFRFNGEIPTEWAAGLGIGARLAMTDAGPLALVDASFERGSRGDVEQLQLAEDFWRLTFSLMLFGR